jgi:hypothetical protein
MLEHFNDRRIAALPVPTREERQHDYWDDILRGFGVRVSYGGKRAFVVRYRVAGRLRRLTGGRSRRRLPGSVAKGERLRCGDGPASPATAPTRVAPFAWLAAGFQALSAEGSRAPLGNVDYRRSSKP